MTKLPPVEAEPNPLPPRTPGRSVVAIYVFAAAAVALAALLWFALLW